MYSNDSPIKNQKDDCLNRKDFVTQLNKLIINYSFDDSLTIGLEGKWGDGKTSIINLLLNSIENEYILVRFNPWNLSDDVDLYDKFFNELLLSIELNDKEKKLKQLKINLKRYKQYVSPILSIGGAVIQSITHIPLNIGDVLNNLVYGKKSLEQLKNDINTELSNQKVKIIVIIDDIDRLTDENIRLIFNLTASVANFKNIIYLLAYDRDVVIKSLNKSQSFSGSNYLKKIVQLSISIPKITTADIEKLSYVYLDKLYSHSLITKEDITLFTQHYDIILGFFRNIRDLKHYFNLLGLYLPLVKNEVNIVDFMLLTIIQVFEKNVYSLIKNKHKYLLYSSGVTIGNNTLNVHYEKKSYQKEQSQEKEGITFYSLLEEQFKRNYNIIFLLIRLFPTLDEIYNIQFHNNYKIDLEDKKLIRKPEYFDKYFIFGEIQYDVSNYDLDNLYLLTKN